MLISQQGKEASMACTEEHALPYGHSVKAAEDIDGLAVSCGIPAFTRC